MGKYWGHFGLDGDSGDLSSAPARGADPIQVTVKGSEGTPRDGSAVCNRRLLIKQRAQVTRGVGGEMGHHLSKMLQEG